MIPGSNNNHLARNEAEEYILGTLLYTPQSYAKHERYLEIKVYAPNESQPAMKILRMIGRCLPMPSTPKNCQEIDFQDEISMIKKGELSQTSRWQINFTILVDKENFKYHSILEAPKRIDYVSESINVFKELAKTKGAKLYAGDWRFESNGEGWVQMTDKKILETTMKSLY
jgi:hypothetical protein